MSSITILDVTPDNVHSVGIFCIKNNSARGQQAKIEWFKKQYRVGLRMNIALDARKKQIGFIEYIPSEFAWRPIAAKNYLFIHCMGKKSKKIFGMEFDICRPMSLE